MAINGQSGINVPQAEQNLLGEQVNTQYHLHDPSQRPLHVIVVGAGPSGIATLIRLKELPHISFRCFEKNADVGGTWLETRYPGAACDIASHAYQYTFESKKDWTRHFAPAEEIGEYFISVAKKHDLHRHISFGSRAVSALWDERTSKWKITIARKLSDSNDADLQSAVHEADVFINAGGILNNWKWPDIKGLNDFQGQLVHTAAWDRSIELKDKSVAIIGSGASSIQVVPSIQPVCAKLDVFVRSPTYILPTVGFGIESSTYNEIYTASQIERFSTDPAYYQAFRKKIEQQMNENFAGSIKLSRNQTEGRSWAEAKMKGAIKSPELQEKLVPNWELGCRRITPGLPYLNAVQEQNVDIVRSGITQIAKDGIFTDDGQLHKADIIICATGFDTSFNRYEITGRGGITLSKRWESKGPEAYLGTAVAGLPNYFVLLGPNCPIANGSLIPCIESSVDYVMQAIVKMQRDQIRSIEVKQTIQDAFNNYVQEVHQGLVWTGACNSWYKDRLTGRVTAVWPGSSIHFMEMLQTPRWEDYELQYMNANPFRFMGNGTSKREACGEDLTFYLDDKVV
ncbi:hypothetical protein V2G26_007479 [Clonostachys chloroleuca]